MAASERIATLIDELPNSTDKMGTLLTLKTLLTSVPPSALRDIVANTSFNVIFECLNTDDSEYLEICCAVLSMLLGSLECDVLLTQFHEELLIGLSHPSHLIRDLTVSQLLSATETNPQQVALHCDIIVQVGARLGDQNLSVAKKAEDTLVKLGGTSEGIEVLFEPTVVEKLHATMGDSDTVRFRVYEVMVRVACISSEALDKCAQSGFLQQLVNEVYKDDLLTQLNALELLKDMALTLIGLNYLEQQGVVGKLQEMIVLAETDVMTGFLLPGLVKFFGNVAHLYPKEVCGRFQDFVALLFRLLHHADITLVSLSIETLGVIGSTVEGKQALEKLGAEMNAAMQRMGEIIYNAPTEIRVKVLNVVSNLLRLQVAEQTCELLALTEQWFNHLRPPAMEMVMNIASQPFTELRCGALELFNTLAQTFWGQTVLNNFPSFNEYLLNRSTEKTKEGKDGKYAIVKTLAESATVEEVFGAPYMVRLKHYQNEGPYYVKVEAAVAFEEAS